MTAVYASFQMNDLLFFFSFFKAKLIYSFKYQLQKANCDDEEIKISSEKINQHAKMFLPRKRSKLFYDEPIKS